MTTLTIHNFGPVHDASIDIRRFNLFIGEQSIGKSTIAKMVAIFTDYMSLALICGQEKGVWEKLLESYDLRLYAKNSDYSIEYSDISDDFRITVKLTAADAKSEVIENGEIRKTTKSIVKALIARKTIYHIESLLPKANTSFEELNQLVLDNVRNSIYIPAERIVASLTNKLLPALMLVKEQIPNNFLRFVTELNNAKSKYSDLEIGLLDVEYKVDEGNEYVALGNGKRIPLKNASSGMQSVIPLLLALKYAKENMQYESYIIEEPECNLFPLKQIELLEILLSELYSTGRSLTITTHSPYLLSAMNNYLYAYKLSKELTTENKDELKGIISDKLWIDTNDCSIYSLGKDINGGEYCKEIKDIETGLIDYNYLDGVSLEMSDKFSKMQRLHVRTLRKSR